VSFVPPVPAPCTHTPGPPWRAAPGRAVRETEPGSGAPHVPSRGCDLMPRLGRDGGRREAPSCACRPRAPPTPRGPEVGRPPDQGRAVEPGDRGRSPQQMLVEPMEAPVCSASSHIRGPEAPALTSTVPGFGAQQRDKQPALRKHITSLLCETKGKV